MKSNRVEWSIKRLSKQVIVLETSCSWDNSREMKSEKKTLKQAFLALEIISAVSWVLIQRNIIVPAFGG